MAVKEAAKASSFDTGRAIEDFYFHRLLCRVFADGNTSFVLKGGHAMLARTIDAHRTRDIDLLSVGNDLDAACRELVTLAQKELGDFTTFEFDGARPIKVVDEYRSGLTIRFVPYVGRKRMQPISIDLVVDEVHLERTEKLTPADRIDVAGIPVCDYLVYPVEIALSDKLHGIIETHNGRASSRVKDIVDIAVYVTTCEIDGDGFQSSIQRETRVRRLSLPESFALPPEWGALHARQYARVDSHGHPNR